MGGILVSCTYTVAQNLTQTEFEDFIWLSKDGGWRALWSRDNSSGGQKTPIDFTL